MSASYQPPRFSVDAIALKAQIEINLAYLKSIQTQSTDQLSAWNRNQLSIVIASHELQLAQLNEDLLINKIL